jgi:glyoxalase family protein
MRLDGIHHISAITADARQNVEFYVGTLGLRMVKKTVNQDDPSVYHLFYGDEHGSPGMDLTFFEYPGSTRGRAGAGMVHTICWRVRGVDSIDFWERRLAGEGFEVQRSGDRLRFADPEGLRHELNVYDGADAVLSAVAPDVPAEHALAGFDGVRAYADDLARSDSFFGELLGFDVDTGAGEWRVGGETRSSFFVQDPAPEQYPIQGAGVVHHVAFTVADEEIAPWQQRLRAGGAHATRVIDRFYFESVYFHEPSGVLFELATKSPGFAVDEPESELGQSLSLPPKFERLRGELAGVLVPLPDPRSSRSGHPQA